MPTNPFDLYDDHQVTLLSKYASIGLPDEFAHSEKLSRAELDLLPDRLFAYVSPGGVRKFAMHDAAHLATSLLYFEHSIDAFNELEACKVAARLAEGCEWYGLVPPETSKVALLGAAMNALNVAGGVASMRDAARTGMAKHKATVANLGKIAAAEVPVNGSDLSAGTTLPPGAPHRADLGGGESAEVTKTVRREVRTSPEEERKLQEGADTPSALQKFLDTAFEKRADLNGSSLMPMGATSKPDKKGAMYRVVATKTSHYALPHVGRYPLDTEVDTKAAARYFDEHVQAFTPFERRVFAQSVWDRGAELGVKVSGRILDYVGDEAGPLLYAELQARRDAYAGTGHDAAYEALLEKVSVLSPAVTAQILLEMDEATGASASYDRPGAGFRDPYAAVYGGQKHAADAEDKKRAEDAAYTWSDGTHHITGLELLSYGKSAVGVGDVFGRKVALDFSQNPVTVFKSMPEPQKKLFVRLFAITES